MVRIRLSIFSRQDGVMSLIQYIDEDRAQGDLAMIYERIRRLRGGVSDVMKLQSLNPSALAAHFELYRSLMFGPSELDRRTREMIGVLVSSANDCSYGVSHHCEALRNLEVPEQVIDELAAGTVSDETLSEALQGLLRYAAALTRSPSSAGSVEQLRELGWTDAAILDATLVCGYFNMLNRLSLGLGISLESSFADTCGPEGDSTPENVAFVEGASS
jgi:uncharacterized peroxidase-related enzyme